jgi:hypothetical protein
LAWSQISPLFAFDFHVAANKPLVRILVTGTEIVRRRFKILFPFNLSAEASCGDS